jgi:CRP-like cAMP-binding protein
LNFEEMTRVMHLISEKRYREGEVLFTEGDEDDRFMILLEGEIVLNRGGVELVKLNPGAHFGEMALVNTATRSATAVAGMPSVLMEIQREQFFRLMRGDTSLAIKCMWSLVMTLSSRLRLTTDEMIRLSELTGDKPSGSAEMFGVTVPVKGPEDHLPEALREMTKSSPAAPPPPPPPLPPGVGSS